MFQHTAARRRLQVKEYNRETQQVSTHSRPKAAAKAEGYFKPDLTFQHTAARRRLPALENRWMTFLKFQHTAARRRLILHHQYDKYPQCFNTQPPEGGWSKQNRRTGKPMVFQHTAARRRLNLHISNPFFLFPFQHTAARRRLTRGSHRQYKHPEFQHTAARRRLYYARCRRGRLGKFQHTAARRRLSGSPERTEERPCFNTQPPEGGCSAQAEYQQSRSVSTHSRPKAAVKRPSLSQ